MAAGKITGLTALTAGTQNDADLLYLAKTPFGVTDDRKATITSLFATSTASGFVSTAAQSLAGAKTFTAALTAQVSVTIGVASSATGTLVLANATNAFTSTISPGVPAASRTFVLPIVDPSAGQAIVGTLAGSTITLSYATLNGGSGTNLQVTLWSGTNTLTGDTGITYTTGANTSIRLISAAVTANAARGFINSQFSTDAVGAQIVGIKARGTSAVPLIVADGDVMMQVSSAGRNNAAANVFSSQVVFAVDGTPGVRVPGSVDFWTDDNSSTTSRWRIRAAGNFEAATDNAYDIGASGALRPRTIYVATSAVLGTAGSTTGTLTLSPSGSAFTTSLQSGALAASRTYILPTADPSAGQALVGTLAGSTITLSYATLNGGSGTANQVALWSATNTLTGDVAITYTTSPGALIVTSAAGGLRGVQSYQYSTDTTPALFLARKGRGTSSVPLDVASGDILSSYQSDGYLNAAFRSGGAVQNIVTAASGSSLDTKIRFIVAVASLNTAAWEMTSTLQLLPVVASSQDIGSTSFLIANLFGVNVQLGVVSSSTGTLKLANSASANLTTIQAGNATGAVTYTLPTAAPTVSGQVLSATTAGVMSWITSGASLVTVTTKTGNYTVTTADTGTHFNNSGAGGTVIFSIPAATVGLIYSFTVATAQILEVLANGTDTIQIGGSVTSAGGNLQNATVGSSTTIVCHVAGKWFAEAGQGSFTTA